MFKYTRNTLKKLENLFGAIEYKVRYEKGNFQSGYCMVENRKIVVINKFFDIEARINCLLEILTTLEVNPEELPEDILPFYQKLEKNVQEKMAEDNL